MLIGSEDETGDGILESVYRVVLQGNVLRLNNIIKLRHNESIDLGTLVSSFRNRRLTFQPRSKSQLTWSTHRRQFALKRGSLGNRGTLLSRSSSFAPCVSNISLILDIMIMMRS